MGRLSSRARDVARGRDIGFVFQQFNLLPGRTALENVVAAAALQQRHAASGARRELAASMLERVGLGDRLDAKPDRLSGGEQQRVAIARALVRGPRLILADEPTGALDIETGASVMALLDEVATESGAALVAITHDLHVAARARRALPARIRGCCRRRPRARLRGDTDHQRAGREVHTQAQTEAETRAEARGGLMSLPSTVVGVTREAWDELRVHKLRVLLSLIGVAVAVAALTAVVAIADLQRQYLAEQNDRWGGREATIAIATFSETGEVIDADAWEEHVDRVLERYEFSHESHSGTVQLPVQLPEGVIDIPARDRRSRIRLDPSRRDRGRTLVRRRRRRAAGPRRRDLGAAVGATRRRRAWCFIPR